MVITSEIKTITIRDRDCLDLLNLCLLLLRRLNSALYVLSASSLGVHLFLMVDLAIFIVLVIILILLVVLRFLYNRAVEGWLRNI